MSAGPQCHACNEHADHTGRHDDLVAAGDALYASDGSVFRIDRGGSWSQRLLRQRRAEANAAPSR